MTIQNSANASELNNQQFQNNTQYLAVEFSRHNNKMPHAITMVPKEEIEEFRKTVVARYLRQISKGFVQRALYKFKSESIKEVSDQEYIDFLTRSTYSKSISPNITDEDKALFSIQPNAEKTFYKFDLRHLGEITPLNGLYITPCIALVSKDNQGQFNAEAIWINEKVFTPKDGDAWDLSKYHVLSVGISEMMFSEHPMVHFPMDAVNAITRSVLPTDHIIHKLMYPHMHLQLPLNYGVLNQHRSVLYNNQKEIYSPYSHQDKTEIFELLGKRYQGELAYGKGTEKYSYPMSEREEHTDVDKFLNEYYRVIFDFVSQAITDVVRRDLIVSKWAKEVSSKINGFPNEVTIWHGDNLARAITGFIWNCGIVHSLDHHSVGELPSDKVPFRVRVAPPIDSNVKLDRKQIMNKSDMSRQRIATDMFVHDHPVSRFIDVDYQFESEELQQLDRDFKNALRETEQNLSVECFMKLDEFAASIQY